MIWIFIVAVLVLDTVYLWPYISEWRRKPMNSEARKDAPGDFVRLSRGMTHYRWHGPDHGPCVVCVHGLTTPSFVWDGLAEDLARQGCRVLVYDLFGRGYSDRPKSRQDAAFLVRQLDELLAAQGVTEPFTLVGYSTGGAIATAFTTVFPERVKQLVLLAPAGLAHVENPQLKLARDVPLIGDWMMMQYFPDLHRAGCEAERALPTSVPGIVDLQIRELEYRGFIPSVLASFRGILRVPLTREHRYLAEQNVPVAAIWGAQDEVIPLSAKEILTGWNPAAQNRVIPGAGHGLPYTHTDAVVAEMRPFLPAN